MPFPMFTEEHALFRQSVRTFAEREVAPHAEEWDRAQEFPRELFGKAGAQGYLGVRFDPAYGGGGLDYWYTGILIEELMRARNVGVVVSLMVQCEIATNIIHAFGSEELDLSFAVYVETKQRCTVGARKLKTEQVSFGTQVDAYGPVFTRATCFRCLVSSASEFPCDEPTVILNFAGTHRST